MAVTTKIEQIVEAPGKVEYVPRRKVKPYKIAKYPPFKARAAAVAARYGDAKACPMGIAVRTMELDSWPYPSPDVVAFHFANGSYEAEAAAAEFIRDWDEGRITAADLREALDVG